MVFITVRQVLSRVGATHHNIIDVKQVPDYRRSRTCGGTYFFTVVTFDRMTFLTSPLARSILRSAWLQIKLTHPFTSEAICLLPDHLHCIWTLPENDSDSSTRWRLIKSEFIHQYLKAGGQEGRRNDSRKRTKESAVWQRIVT